MEPSERPPVVQSRTTGIWEAGAAGAPSWSLPAVTALDLAIAVYAVLLLSVIAFGGIDIGFLTARGAAKPALILLLLAPIRAALPVETWLSARLARLWSGVATSPLLGRIPAAVRDVAFALVVTRIATFTIGFIANVLLVPNQPRPFSIAVPWQKFVETFAILDSGWYFDIASRGYYFSEQGQSSVAFFPLYPMMMRLVSPLFGSSEAAVWLAGIAVSWVAFALALVALHGLTERLTGSREVARRTGLYVAVFPFSFYYMRVYTESLFLLVTVLAFSGAVRGRWVQAGLFGAMAAATRPNGVLLALPLLILACADRPSIPVAVRRLLALAPIPLAVVAYSAYVYTLTGDPLAWMEAQAHWDYTVGNPPYRHLLIALAGIEERGLYEWILHSPTAPYEFVYSILALMFLAAVPAIIRRFGWAFGVYVLIGVVLPLSGNVLEGMGRYASVLFPVFMVAGTISSPRLHEALLVVSCLFRTLFQTLFITWHPLH